ncbi:MAG: LysM peptidoglycan-binding domain-containing protein, partial [Spirochaetes bacterium]|nr:LysM peptidoglycan-binding domain-containing protein [Spirochaetota bacterium]
GKDPDWIYPDNILVMPDSTKIVVKSGDTMWNICENFLIDQINRDELEIRELIEKTKTKEITIKKAKKRFLIIKEESYSEMLRDFLDTLIELKNFKKWEPYLKERR